MKKSTGKKRSNQKKKNNSKNIEEYNRKFYSIDNNPRIPINTVTSAIIKNDAHDEDLYEVDSDDEKKMYFEKLFNNTQIDEDSKKFLLLWNLFVESEILNFDNYFLMVLKFIENNKNLLIQEKFKYIFFYHIKVLYNYSKINIEEVNKLCIAVSELNYDDEEKTIKFE